MKTEEFYNKVEMHLISLNRAESTINLYLSAIGNSSEIDHPLPIENDHLLLI